MPDKLSIWHVGEAAGRRVEELEHKNDLGAKLATHLAELGDVACRRLDEVERQRDMAKALNVHLADHTKLYERRIE